MLVSLAADPSELPERTAALERARALRASPIRVAAFTSTDRAADLARLAAEQDAELLVVDTLPDGLLAAAPCDVAFVPGGAHSTRMGPCSSRSAVGETSGPRSSSARGSRARTDVPLKLLGIEADGGRRDASRMLASASLALQRFTGTVAEPVIVAPGVDGILAERAR